MANKTKKVGSAGRFGSRYGKKIRDNVQKLEVRSKTKHKCPQCGKISLKRKASGIWGCTKCGTEVTGGAWVPQTELGRVTSRVVQSGMKGKAAVEEMESLDKEEEAK